MDENNNDLRNDDVRDIGKDLIKSFHEQFAQNQNHHQNLFIQTLAILLTVLVGYGYLYIRVNKSVEGIFVGMDTLYAFLTIALYLLTIAIALLSNMALGFRRDQLMAANIRIKSNVMTPENNDNYFFGTFNPYSKKGYLDWMPEFHSIFFISLFVMKILLMVLTLKYENNSLGIFYSEHMSYIVIAMFSYFLDIMILDCYRKKWEKHLDSAPERLKI